MRLVQKIQATYRMYQTKANLALFHRSVGRIQAAFRGIHYRTKWCSYRNAINIMQWFFKGFIIKNRYTKKMRALRKLQRYFSKMSRASALYENQAWFARFAWFVEGIYCTQACFKNVRSSENYSTSHS